ncbi:MAG TPA: alpha/beta hydrolase [Acidimicrobiales bacterium]|nr:alpha/beta hydrolase [Acidimicrobiales bacterium]
MPIADVNGVEIHYELEGDGPNVLFCNGSGATLETAGPLIDRLRPKLRVLAFDARGMGKSSAVSEPYAMADLAADALGLLDHVGWRTTRLLGVSFGGMVAQEVAVTSPERIERLALMCTSAGGAGGSSYPLHELASLTPDERAAISLRLVDSRFSPEWFAEHPLDDAIMRARAASAAEPRSEERSTGERLQMQARAAHDVSTRLDRITCPTLIGCGHYDGIAPLANSEWMAAHIADAKLEVYEGGHMFFVQDSTALPAVVEFLRGS